MRNSKVLQKILCLLLSFFLIGFCVFFFAGSTKPNSSEKSEKPSDLGNELPRLSEILSDDIQAESEETSPESSSKTEESELLSRLINEISTGRSESSASKESSAASSPSSSVSPKSESAVSTAPILFPTVGKAKMVWISYLELQTLLKNKAQKETETQFQAIFKEIASWGIDTVFLQVRPFSDAIYPSEYYPWSHILTGTRGKNPGYDPLKSILSAATGTNLAIHAWINPYRVATGNLVNQMPSKDRIASRKDVISYDGGLYLNPASTDAQALIANGVAELMKNYPALAGIHMDDYFYPTTATAFDADSYAAYQKSGGKLNLADFRRSQVTTLCKAIHTTVKKASAKALFGISPAGNLDTVRNKNYVDVDALAKDSKAIDYLCPQIYFGYQNQSQPFQSVLNQWKDVCKNTTCKLYVGLPFYKMGKEDTWAGDGKSEFLQSGSLTAMTKQLLSDSSVSGLAYYSFDSIYNPNKLAKIEWANITGYLLAR